MQSRERMEALGRLDVSVERIKAATKGLKKGGSEADIAAELGVAFVELMAVAELIPIQAPLNFEGARSGGRSRASGFGGGTTGSGSGTGSGETVDERQLVLTAGEREDVR